MIETVDSSKIDLTAAKAFIADLFVEPKPKTLEVVVEEYKEQIKKSVPVREKRFQNYVHPSTHAEKILKLVADSLEVNVVALKSKSRIRVLVEARFIYCFLVMKLSTVQTTLLVAGHTINKDHATVINGVKKAIELNENNVPFQIKMDQCITEFKRQFPGVESFILDYNNIPQY